MPFYLFSFEKMYGNTQGSGNLETCHGEKQTNKPTKNQKTYVFIRIDREGQEVFEEKQKIKKKFHSPQKSGH